MPESRTTYDSLEMFRHPPSLLVRADEIIQ
jgi:hypothetical protein